MLSSSAPKAIGQQCRSRAAVHRWPTAVVTLSAVLFSGPAVAAPNSAPSVSLSAAPTKGTAPLKVSFDASKTTDADGDTLSYFWDFGDGTQAARTDAASAAATVSDPSAALIEAYSDYNLAYWTRKGNTSLKDANGNPTPIKRNPSASIPLYKIAAHKLYGLQDYLSVSRPTEVPSKYKSVGLSASFYLMKIGHGAEAAYYNNKIVDAAGRELTKCERLEGAYLWAKSAVEMARAKKDISNLWSLVNYCPIDPATGKPDKKGNCTYNHMMRALNELNALRCEVPAYVDMFKPDGGPDVTPPPPPPPPSGSGSPTVSHTYTAPGSYTAKVTVKDSANTVTKSVNITVSRDEGEPTDPTAGPFEGYGNNRGADGSGKPVVEIQVTDATEAAVRTAFSKASKGSARITFAAGLVPIKIKSPLPVLSGSYITIEGNGVTLYGDSLSRNSQMINVTGNNMIFKNMRLRNGGDNIQLKGPAHHIVLSHISSSGAGDDGIAVYKGARDVTIRYCFLAGNTRSIFIKYGGSTNVSLHHTWIQKQWIRGPMVHGAHADIRNIIVEDWTMWGLRFTGGATGNLVNSLFNITTPDKTGKRFSKKVVNNAVQYTGDDGGPSGPVFTSGLSVQGLAVVPQEGEASEPYAVPAVPFSSASAMEADVRANAGCQPRDEVDNRYINDKSNWNVSKYEPLRYTAE